MNVGQRIGRGQTAEIFALDIERVVKRFTDSATRDIAEREVENTRVAAAAGLPVPTVYELTSLDSLPVIVYERIHGKTMLARLESHPWTVRQNAHRLARLHRQIHDVETTTPRLNRERLRRNIETAPGISAAARNAALSRLDSLPAGNSLCHGDFHPENVLLNTEGVTIIDWLDASVGHPAADVARTNLLLRFAGQPEGHGESLRRAFFRRWYLRAYCADSDLTRDEVRAWELPVAAARLTEGVPEAPRLRSFVESRSQRE